MDRGIVDPDELLVEQWAQEASSDVIHGHAAAELVEGWHDDRLFREFQITLVFPQKRDPHPARDNLSVAHPIASARLGMWTPFSRSSSSSPIWRSATTSASSAMRTGSSGIGSRSTVARREESA